MSFIDKLSEDRAFYNQSDYIKTTQQNFAQTKLLPVNYTWNTESKIIRISKQILSIIIFPIGIYKFLHALAGKVALLPASTPSLMDCAANHANNSRKKILVDSEWKYKRMTIEVDGYKIDTVIVGTAATLNNGRWTLYSNGNGQFYEDKLRYKDGFELLRQINSNAIMFNYSGVGTSSGLPNKQAMTKAYCAMLNFLEDKKEGIGAKEIIGYGHSIGAGVQGDALKTHELKQDIKYVFVKSRTFSDMRTIASALTIKPLGFLVKILGWNIDPVGSSKKLQAPEIILQTAQVKSHQEIHDSLKIIGDGIITADASLAKALLDDTKCLRKNKVFIGIQEDHNKPLNDPSFLAQKIEELLKV
jgi:Chlamydia CHLPS protein (DUF818)